LRQAGPALRRREPTAAELKPGDCLAGTPEVFPGEDVHVQLTVTNTSRWPIKAFKGVVYAQNSFGDPLLSGNVEKYLDLPAGASQMVIMNFHINMFDRRHDQMARTPKREVASRFDVTSVQFANGEIVD
jgi:hypothetical protein